MFATMDVSVPWLSFMRAEGNAEWSIGVYQFQFWKKKSCYLRKNLPTKYQLTVQMTWHEGKSEGFREILRHDKRNRNAICGL